MCFCFFEKLLYENEKQKNEKMFLNREQKILCNPCANMVKYKSAVYVLLGTGEVRR